MKITRRQKRSRRVITRRDPKADRHQKFTARRKRMIYAALEGDIPIVRACMLAGIEYATYSKWLSLGRNPEYPAFHAFRKKCLRIEAKKEMESMDIIRKCAKGGQTVVEVKMSDTYRGKETHRIIKTMPPQWTAAAWRLERKYPKEYGRNIPVEDDSKLTEDQKAEALRNAVAQMIATVPTEGLPLPAGPDDFYDEEDDEEENGEKEYTNGLDI